MGSGSASSTHRQFSRPPGPWLVEDPVEKRGSKRGTKAHVRSCQATQDAKARPQGWSWRRCSHCSRRRCDCRLRLVPLQPNSSRLSGARILTEPKNALVRQYQKLFAYESVNLEFTPEALKRIAQKAIERDTGARGLRSILEQVLRKPMFEIPSLSGIEHCIVDEDVIDGTAEVKTTPVDLQTLAEAAAADEEPPLQMAASGG